MATTWKTAAHGRYGLPEYEARETSSRFVNHSRRSSRGSSERCVAIASNPSARNETVIFSAFELKTRNGRVPGERPCTRRRQPRRYEFDAVFLFFVSGGAGRAHTRAQTAKI